MNKFLILLLASILLFSPLAFGAVLPWTQLLLLCCSCVLSVSLLFKDNVVLTPPAKAVFLCVGGLIVLGLVQSLSVKTILSAPFWTPFTISRLDTLDFCGYLLCLLGFFFAASQLVQKHDHIKLFSGFISLCGLIVALIGFSSGKGEYINFFTGIGYITETFGPFLNRNHAAVFITLCFFVSLVWSVPATLDHIKTKKNADKKELLQKAFCACIITLLLACALIYSRSRGGILGFSCGLFLYCGLLSVVLFKKLRSKLFAITIVFAAILLFITAITANEDAINKFARRDGDNWGFSVQTRKNLYNAGYYMFLDYKTFGLGLNATANGIFPYLDKPIKSYVEHLHNDWLELLAGGGIAAAVILLAALFMFLRALYFMLRRTEEDKRLTLLALISGLFAMFFASFFDFHFYIPANALLFFVIAGLICAPTFSTSKTKHLRAGKVYAALLLALFVPFILLSAHKTEAWRNYVLGKNINSEAKLPYFERALAAWPHPRYALRLAIANYNLSNDTSLPADKRKALRAQAQTISAEYLKKYPLYKELVNVQTRSGN